MDKLTCAKNTELSGGDPKRSSYAFNKKERDEYMNDHKICQLCKIALSVECAHINSGDPKGQRYNGNILLENIKSKKI